MKTRNRVPVEVRLTRRMVRQGDCWIWTGATMKNGYGTIGITSTDGLRRQNALVHRVSYELYVGPIPAGLQLDHLCRVRNCFNPRHLEPVTARENQRRMGAALTHCRKAGHEFTPENTGRDKFGNRYCLTCNAIARELWETKNRAKRVEQRKARAARDRDKRREQHKAWAAANRDHINAYAREWRARKKAERLAVAS